MEKPIEFTMVKAVPFNSIVELNATSVEKSGESAITTIPQKIIKVINRISEFDINNSGDNKQHKPDKAKV